MTQTINFLSVVNAINEAAQNMQFGGIIAAALTGIILVKLYTVTLKALMSADSKVFFIWLKKLGNIGAKKLNKRGRYDIDSPTLNKIINYAMAFTDYLFALCFFLIMLIIGLLWAIKGVDGFWNITLAMGSMVFFMIIMRLYKVHGDENLYKARNG